MILETLPCGKIMKHLKEQQQFSDFKDCELNSQLNIFALFLISQYFDFAIRTPLQ